MKLPEDQRSHLQEVQSKKDVLSVRSRSVCTTLTQTNQIPPVEAQEATLLPPINEEPQTGEDEWQLLNQMQLVKDFQKRQEKFE